MKSTGAESYLPQYTSPSKLRSYSQHDQGIPHESNIYILCMGNTRERSAKGITNQGRLTTTNPARLADHRQQERPAQITVRGLREEYRHNLKSVWSSLHELSVNLIISVYVPLVYRQRRGRVWILSIYNPHGRNSYTLGNPDGLRNSWDNGGRKHPPVQDTALLSNPQII